MAEVIGVAGTPDDGHVILIEVAVGAAEMAVAVEASVITSGPLSSAVAERLKTEE